MQDREIISAIRQIRRAQIEELLTEWDQISREVFLKKYDVFPAQKYWLVHNGKTYDAKAVLVPALRRSNPLLANLSANSFSGTNATVAQPLRDLGFSIKEHAEQPRYW